MSRKKEFPLARLPTSLPSSPRRSVSEMSIQRVKVNRWKLGPIFWTTKFSLKRPGFQLHHPSPLNTASLNRIVGEGPRERLNRHLEFFYIWNLTYDIGSSFRSGDSGKSRQEIRGCPKRKFYDKEIEYIEINTFDEDIYCISY